MDPNRVDTVLKSLDRHFKHHANQFAPKEPYEYQEYPKALHHAIEGQRQVNSPEEEDALTGSDPLWSATPGEAESRYAESAARSEAEAEDQADAKIAARASRRAKQQT
jgi:hypothetical protein